MTTLPDNGEMEGSRLYTLGGVLPGISWDRFEQLDYLYSIFLAAYLFVNNSILRVMLALRKKAFTNTTWPKHILQILRYRLWHLPRRKMPTLIVLTLQHNLS